MLARTHPAFANQHYRDMELQSRVASASPHGLVSLLYEELLHALDLLTATAKRGTAISGNPHHTKALSIIIALETSIDFANGGDLAGVLQRIYRSAVYKLNAAAQTNDVAHIAELREAVSEIAYAWAALAN
ncbi:flagellar protein FliS [Sphingorhabdus wooponensis]|uniref:Flagellar protein FliS n=2 Tax=Sphingorhabdus wooponensis TaxID=940136 RepID=A0A3R8R794_9SPHN|nr:flagellar protein FliS [Sphingorhabdus wooponensis]